MIPFRASPSLMAEEARKAGTLNQIRIQLWTLLAFWAVLAWIRPLWFFGLFMPSWYLAQVLTSAINYCQHRGTEPGTQDRLRDAVSCYHPLVNFFGFNLGFHQEHHYSPQVHWTEWSTITAELPPKEDRPTFPRAYFSAGREAVDSSA
jgi:fatty acid desaturase